MKLVSICFRAVLFGLGLITGLNAARAVEQTSVTQYGVTWTFDRPRPVGQFITGDYWVQGPVTIVSVVPAAASAVSGDSKTVKSRYGATAMVDDNRMRNGSMVSPRPGISQGYDSRLKNYAPELSTRFPVTLKAGETLVSSISNETLPVQVMQHALMWAKEREAPLALNTAALLTVVATPPPVDAFRPAYAGGSDRALYRTSNLHWDRLPSLPKPAGATVPDWAMFERYLQRPWLDYTRTWMFQYMGPSENQVNYGREYSRITSIATLMLMLDVPRQKKERLMIGLVQLGIDLRGVAQAGGSWTADGGHWNGRKWPILFAGLMLGDDTFSRSIEGTLFSEDQQIYYGSGWCGQTALFQIVFHTGQQKPYEEKPPASWDAADKRSESYRIVVSGGLPGTALAAQLMGAKALWNHDAFFDYYDRWMSPKDIYAGGRGDTARPKQEGAALDPFVTAMWTQYRDKAPQQSVARDNRMWAWGKSEGGYVPNLKPTPSR